MFDIAPSELLLVVIVAIVVIGPKDLPLALRTAGRWIGKIRRVSNHFRSGIESMIREADLEEMERKWKEQNAAIMAQSASPVTVDATGAPMTFDPSQTPAAASDQHVPVAPELLAHAPTEPVIAPVTDPSAVPVEHPAGKATPSADTSVAP